MMRICATFWLLTNTTQAEDLRISCRARKPLVLAPVGPAALELAGLTVSGLCAGSRRPQADPSAIRVSTNLLGINQPAFIAREFRDNILR